MDLNQSTVGAGGHAVRIALALAVALVTYLSFPASPVVESPIYEVGSVAPDRIVSPVPFVVPKDPRELQRERDDAARRMPPIFQFLPMAADTATRLVNTFFAAVDSAAARGDASQQAVEIRERAESLGVRLITAEAQFLANTRQRQVMRQAITNAVSQILANGVAPAGALDTMRGDISVRRADSLVLYRADSIVTFGQFLARARTQASGLESRIADELYGKLLTTFFRPTLAIDRPGTESRRSEARESVSPNRFEVRANEAIVRANEVVGPVEFEKMRALQGALQLRSAGTRDIGRITGSVLFNATLIALFGLTIFMFRPQLYGSVRALITMALLFALVVLAAGFVSRVPSVQPELVPIAVVAIVFGILFDSRIAIIATMMLAVLIGGQTAFRATNAQFLNLVAGVAAVFSVRIVRQRNQAYHSMITVAGAYAVAALAVGLTLTLDQPVVEILRSALLGAVNAVITVPFAMLVVLPLAEDFTGTDTYPRLLEWSDLNRPLMRQLSLEAPGTYAHTMTIANLAESACNAIGANGMLARVGAYYHDIGKLGAPQYFVENQAPGRNPHDLLDPNASASIIRNHVVEGLALAEKHRIPKTIRAFITEHHGTSPITYFLQKSTELHGQPDDLEAFRYPGPIPQSAETAVVMLGDGVEAATRVLNDPTPQKIREVVDHIVKHRLEQGQLRDAPLTLKQIDTVKDQFTRVLSAAHHTRIDYPASAGGITAEFAS